MPATPKCLGFVPFFLTASVFFPSSLKVLPWPPAASSPSSSFVCFIPSFHSLPFQARFLFLMFLPSLLAAVGLAVPSAFAQQSGSFVAVGETLVSAMMVLSSIYFLQPIAEQSQMFVGSADKVYIIDKVEGNAHQINNHSAYAAVW
jgi:hypothetical protein